MLIRDAKLQEQHAFIDPYVFTKWQNDQWCLKQLEANDLVKPEELANFLRQKGNSKTPAQLETWIRILLGVDRCCFEVNPWNPGRKALYLIQPNQERWYCLSYENREMPEYSVLELVETWEVDLDVDHIDKAEVIRTNNHGGQKLVKKAGAELLRGWRTVFVTLVIKGLVTPNAVERLVGGSDRASWNRKLGKKSVRAGF